MEHLVGGFSYVSQNHIVCPKVFPKGKIHTHELVQLGYNWFYENSLSNKNCNLQSASESPVSSPMPFLPLLSKHTHGQF